MFTNSPMRSLTEGALLAELAGREESKAGVAAGAGTTTGAGVRTGTVRGGVARPEKATGAGAGAVFAAAGAVFAAAVGVGLGFAAKGSL